MKSSGYLHRIVLQDFNGGSTSRRFGDRHLLGNLIFSFFLHKNEKIRVILPQKGFENRFFSMTATPSLIFWIRHCKTYGYPIG
jgi:hypothetical protein